MSPQTTPNSIQKKRWCYTLHNYDNRLNYRTIFRLREHDVQRAVWGKEGPPPHHQGYVEFNRTYRLGHVRRVLPNAHWTPAIQNSIANYRYCSKSGNFEVFGDFSREILLTKPSERANDHFMVIKGLLADDDSAISPQVNTFYNHVY